MRSLFSLWLLVLVAKTTLLFLGAVIARTTVDNELLFRRLLELGNTVSHAETSRGDLLHGRSLE